MPVAKKPKTALQRVVDAISGFMGKPISDETNEVTTRQGPAKNRIEAAKKSAAGTTKKPATKKKKRSARRR